MGTPIIQFFETQADKLIMAELAILIVLFVIQLIKTGRANKHLRFLAKGLSGYLEVVLETGAEEDEEEPVAVRPTFVAQQEQEMRETLERQKQQKKLRDAQVFDAVLSEMFP